MTIVALFISMRWKRPPAISFVMKKTKNEKIKKTRAEAAFLASTSNERPCNFSGYLLWNCGMIGSWVHNARCQVDEPWEGSQLIASDLACSIEPNVHGHGAVYFVSILLVGVCSYYNFIFFASFRRWMVGPRPISRPL